MACLYRLVVELEHNIVDGEPYDWVIAYGLELNDPLSNYITAMMWSIQTMTTVGYGDVVSVLECHGTVPFSSCVGSE